MNPFRGHLALVVGHERAKAGAFGIYPISSPEYVYNTDLAELISRFGKSRGHEVSIFFRDGVGIQGAYQQVNEWEPDAVIELHFNAFNGEVRGTETLYADTDDQKGVLEKEFAEFVQKFICGVFGRSAKEDRGIKNRALSRGERGFMSVNQVFGFPSILIEPFFGDNKNDAKMAVERKQELAEAIIYAFEEWKKLIAFTRGYIESMEKRVARDTPDTPETPDTPDTPSTPGTKETTAIRGRGRRKKLVSQKK